MPFDSRTWDFVSDLDALVEAEYWRRAPNYAPGLSQRDVDRAARGLIQAKRPAAAIDLLAMALHGPDQPNPETILRLLEMVLASPADVDGRRIEGHHIKTLLERLHRSVDLVDEIRLAKLEWALLPALSTHSVLPAALERFVARDPDFFVELLTTVYRPHRRAETPGGEEEIETIDEQAKQRAQRAWRLLREWRRIPGTQADNKSVNSTELRAWVETARQKATAADRLEVCDVTIGEVLARSGYEPNGSWPMIAIRDLIDAIDSPRLERGFANGALGRRGTYSKTLGEGGGQERNQAAAYERHAESCRTRWPRTAAVLMRVANVYRQQARQEDQEAQRADF